jgi:protease-4
MSQTPVPPPAPLPPRPQVVQVVAKSGGFTRAITFVIGLLLMGGIFLFGLLVGFFGAGLNIDAVMEQGYRDGVRGRVAIIPVNGIIDGSQAEFVRTAVKHVLAAQGSFTPFDAVVLRVDSPGGGVTASDQIWNEVGRLRDAGLPVVASYGAVAASGGYYISCATDEIIAEPTTVTGSIGVIAQVFTMEELMGKVGIEPVTIVATGSPEKDAANDPFRAWTDRDREKVLDQVDAAYAIFNRRVLDGRGAVIGEDMTLDELADGSVYTADRAIELGLVDSIGYLDDAIAAAEKRAGIPTGRATAVIVTRPPSLFGPGGGLLGSLRPQVRSFDAETIRRLANDLGSVRLMYLMR